MNRESIIINCDKANLKKLRTFLNDQLVSFSIKEQDVSLIILAVDEICSNIIIHANHCDTSKTMEMHVEYTNQIVKIILLDKGELFDYNTYNEPEIEALINEKRKGSLGLMLVRRIMDKVEFTKKEGVNECVMYKNIK